jgi:hypothetical protein
MKKIGFLSDLDGDYPMLSSLGIYVNENEILQYYRPPNNIRDEFGPALDLKGFPNSKRGDL